MDKSEKLKSIHRVTRVWCEEATELSKEDFNQIDLRLRGVANPQIVCTFNPIDQDSWINTEFWQFGDTDKVKLLHTTFLDNKFVGEEYSAVMDRLKIQNPRMYEIYALGLWGQALEGVIFKYDDIQKVPEEAKLLCRGMDFGFTNDPTALIAIYLWNGKIILDEELYKRQMTNQDLIRFFEDIGLSRSEQIRADSSEPKSIEEIHRAGYNIVGATKGKDSINFGIDTMKQYDILITARSQNLKKEFKNYCWAQDKNGKMLNTPIDDFNHAIDGVRYGFELLAKKREIFTY
jgi:phage terminase large subunit